jgi:hypothetical protein
MELSEADFDIGVGILSIRAVHPHELKPARIRLVGISRRRHHAMDQKKLDDKKRFDMSGNQGEGNRGAAAKYDSEASRFAHSGKPEKMAHEVVEGLDGTEANELRRAERERKRRSRLFEEQQPGRRRIRRFEER